MAEAASGSGPFSLSWSDVELIQSRIPPLDASLYKGQAGKVAIVGGCREYTGAPFFAAISAMRIGADLAHVFCTSAAADVIKSYSPELIVHPYLVESYELEREGADGSDTDAIVQQSVASVERWLPRFDSMVIGPGLGRDELMQRQICTLIEAAKKQQLPLILDGDGLFLASLKPEIIRGYAPAVITPNVMEFRRLAEALQLPEPSAGAGADAEGSDASAAALAEALAGPVVLMKGPNDVASDGTLCMRSTAEGCLRRCGGQGDVLAGAVAAFVAWARGRGQSEPSMTNEDLIRSAYAAGIVTKTAARMAFQEHQRAMLATDIIAKLGSVVSTLEQSRRP